MNLFAALASALAIAAGPETTLDAHRWTDRPILVFAAAGDPRLEEQIARFEAEREALAARDNVVIVDIEAGSALRARFAPGPFTVILVGKDGGEKFRANRVVAPGELNALIDTMPMRRREMQRQGDRAR